MIRAYFGMLASMNFRSIRLITGTSGIELTDAEVRAARTRESAVRETLGKMKAVRQLVYPWHTGRFDAATPDL